MRSGDAVPPYTGASRARLVLASELVELVGLAQDLVLIGGHELCEDGSATFAAEVLATSRSSHSGVGGSSTSPWCTPASAG